MLIWLATFSGVSLALMCAVRWGLNRIRKRRIEQLKAIEVRCRQTPEDLGLPLNWRTSPKTCDAVDYQWAQAFQWIIPLGVVAAGAAWSATGQNGWSWTGIVVGLGISLLVFLVMTVWMSWRRQTTIPTQTRRLALALRCWAVRMNAGIECRLALEKTAKQLRRVDPELARHLEAGAAAPAESDLLQRAFYPCGTGVAEQLANLILGKVADVPAELRELADRLEYYYLNQAVSRTRLIDGWLKYPIALCLVPAVNLIAFGPAITNLLEKFGTVRFPAPKPGEVRPIEIPIKKPKTIPPGAI